MNVYLISQVVPYPGTVNHFIIRAEGEIQARVIAAANTASAYVDWYHPNDERVKITLLGKAPNGEKLPSVIASFDSGQLKKR